MSFSIKRESGEAIKSGENLLIEMPLSLTPSLIFALFEISMRRSSENSTLIFRYVKYTLNEKSCCEGSVLRKK